MASAIFIVISSLLLSSICFAFASSNNGGGFTVDLIHRDSRRSPFFDPSNTRFERMRSAFHRSFSRKSAFLSSFEANSFDAPLISAGGEYVMKINIGTPPVEVLGIADTGSDLTWTQCKPCMECYNQTLPLFEPSDSSSYRSISCQSSQCVAAGTSQCDSDNHCQYEVGYGDSSHTRGELATETLTFDGGVSFPKVAFGCGHDNAGTFGQTGSGIVGLGGGSVSIIKQLQPSIGGKFSYCLTFLNSNSSSTISFGSNAIVAGPNVVSTPLVNQSPSTYYYLTLKGITVDGAERVDYKKFSDYGGEDPDYGNIIIDSGTTLTFVPSEMYNEVEAALTNVITDHERVSDPQGGVFGLCYRASEGDQGVIKSPPITFHFKNADLVLPEESVFVEVEQGVVCLTVVPSQDLAIFGNLHQINYHVGYDLVKKQVSFLQTDCSKIQ